MPLPGKEQESLTCVTMDGMVRRFSTTVPKDMRYMMRKGLVPSSVHKIDGEEIAWDFDLPVDWRYLPRPKGKRKPKQVDVSVEQDDEEDDAE